MSLPFDLQILSDIVLLPFGMFLVTFLSVLVLAALLVLIASGFNSRAVDEMRREEKDVLYLLQQASGGFSQHKTIKDIILFLSSLFRGGFDLDCLSVYLNDGQALVLQDGSCDRYNFIKTISLETPLLPLLMNTRVLFDLDTFQCGDARRPADLSEDFIKKIPARMAFALRRNEAIIGVIFLGDRKASHKFAARDQAVLRLIADQASLAIENALYSETKKKDFIEEMHDRRLKDIGILGSTVSHQMCNRLQRVTLGAGMFRLNFSEQSLQTDTREQLVSKILETHEDMRVMENNAVNVAEVADAIRTFSKPGFDQSDVKLKRLVKIAKDLADAKHGKFHCDFIQDIPEDVLLRVNISSIQDVFFNAFDNSYDSMKMKAENAALCSEEYCPAIVVSANVYRGMVVIEIKDNGLGVKPEDDVKLFSPFFTTKGADKGTGLGLYAMRELVARNAGKVELISEYLLGATVVITLPVSENLNGQSLQNSSTDSCCKTVLKENDADTSG